MSRHRRSARYRLPVDGARASPTSSNGGSTARCRGTCVAFVVGVVDVHPRRQRHAPRRARCASPCARRGRNVLARQRLADRRDWARRCPRPAVPRHAAPRDEAGHRARSAPTSDDVRRVNYERSFWAASTRPSCRRARGVSGLGSGTGRRAHVGAIGSVTRPRSRSPGRWRAPVGSRRGTGAGRRGECADVADAAHVVDDLLGRHPLLFGNVARPAPRATPGYGTRRPAPPCAGARRLLLDSSTSVQTLSIHRTERSWWLPSTPRRPPVGARGAARPAWARGRTSGSPAPP